MKLSQYTHFDVRSNILAPAELTRRIGVEPNMAVAKHSQSRGAVLRPKFHMWGVECRDPKLSVGQQIDQLVERLATARDAIRELTIDLNETFARLSVARYFGDEDGIGDSNGFGWYLSPEVLGFLAYVRADLDVDEYDLLDEEE